MNYPDLNDDTKAYVLSKFYPDCEETNRNHSILLNKLFLLCEGNFSCIEKNHQRIKELCSINHANIFEFKDKIISFAMKHDLKKKQVFSILADASSLTFLKIKMKYEHSVAAKKMRNRLMSNDLNVSIRFDNASRNILIIQEVVDGKSILTLQIHKDDPAEFKEFKYTKKSQIEKIISKIFTNELKLGGTMAIISDITYIR